MPRTILEPAPRRRRSLIPYLLLLILGLVLAFLVYLGFSDSEEPLQKIEQDVTNEVLAK
jgi:hypothetical protein